MPRDSTGTGPGWIGGALVALLVALPAARAHAQDADELFRAGVALREAGDSAGAIDLLRRAHALDSEPRVAYNLAAALAERGDYVDARLLLRRLVGPAAPNLLIRDAAQQLLERIAPQIATVRVQIEGASPGQRVVVDDSRSAPDGHEIALDPGTHWIEVRARGGAVLARSEITLEPGERAAVVLRPVSAVPGDTSLGGREDPAPAGTTTADPSSGGDDPWLWIGISAGVVVVLAAVVTGSAIALAGQGGAAIDGDLEDVHVGVAP